MLCQTNKIKHHQQRQLLHLHRHAAKAVLAAGTEDTAAVVGAAKVVPAVAADAVKVVRVVPVAVPEDGRAASGNSSAKRKSASSASKRSI